MSIFIRNPVYGYILSDIDFEHNKESIKTSVVDTETQSTFLEFPTCNHSSNEKEHVYELDIPGMTRNDVNIRLDKQKRILTISGERVEKKDLSMYHIREVQYGKFERIFILTNDADLNNASAIFDNGVLKITFPKIKSDSTQTVELKLD